MSSLMPFVDVLIANEEDAEKVFELKPPIRMLPAEPVRRRIL